MQIVFPKSNQPSGPLPELEFKVMRWDVNNKFTDISELLDGASKSY